MGNGAPQAHTCSHPHFRASAIALRCSARRRSLTSERTKSNAARPRPVAPILWKTMPGILSIRGSADASVLERRMLSCPYQPYSVCPTRLMIDLQAPEQERSAKFRSKMPGLKHRGTGHADPNRVSGTRTPAVRFTVAPNSDRPTGMLGALSLSDTFVASIDRNSLTWFWSKWYLKFVNRPPPFHHFFTNTFRQSTSSPNHCAFCTFSQCSSPKGTTVPEIWVRSSCL